MLSQLLDARTSAVKVAPDLYELRRSDGTKVQIGWNSGAASVRNFASKNGEDAYCLEDAGRGRLNSDAAGCHPDALVVSGSNLLALLGS